MREALYVGAFSTCVCQPDRHGRNDLGGSHVVGGGRRGEKEERQEGVIALE
jgi:hypothetical protein